MTSLLTAHEKRFAESVVRLTYCNPFLPERIAFEREALGDDFDGSMAEWNLHGDVEADHPNVKRLLERSEHLVEALSDKLRRTKRKHRDLQIYEDLVLFILYYRFRDVFDKTIESTASKRGTSSLANSYSRFGKTIHQLLFAPHFVLCDSLDTAHLFAVFFQVKRAFHYIFRNIIGTSQPAARFRAAAWQSIFTHDLRRYKAGLYKKMGDITTLITGPSGTGKELAARAVAMARYVPFNPKSGEFVTDFHRSFHAVNLSAFSETLIESELFGHVRGAFTGAVVERLGRFEECRDTETVFLDEIGDLDPGIQIKLLRVLQSRVFQRIGDNEDRRFLGKVIAATNRDLAKQMQTHRFREDLYYRLCADMIKAPSLAQRLEAQPGELPDLVLFIARRLLETGAEALTDEVMAYIRKRIGLDYRWPGNVRELEQCVRNVLVRGEYVPQHVRADSFDERLVQNISEGTLTIDELLRQYCTLTYLRTGSYEETARRLQADRRTIKARVDAALLERLRTREDPST